MKNVLITILISILITACADTAIITKDPSYKQIVLDGISTAYVAIPKDGRYGRRTYNGSGLTVSTIIRSSLLTHLLQVDEGNEVESLKQATASAQSNAADYLFFPTILHWEDRATEWSGIPDKVQIKIVVFDLGTSEIVSSVHIDGKSGVATMGGDHPQDLLSDPVVKYVNGLFK